MTANTPRTLSGLGDKIQAHHRDRLAMVYIRQSTLQQVERHRESTRLQYDLVEHAMRLGWPRERIVVIDDDLGCSGTTVEGRPGFQRLVADVGLGRVGLVLGIEMSRLARSCRDWYQLLEICALRGTLIGDAEGVCDPAIYNDRLLLGLKGTLSEAELHLIQARMQAGRSAKAQRGDLAVSLPRGYVRRADGSVMLDPDERVQTAIRLVFRLFERYGTIDGVLRHLVAHDLLLPDRRRSGIAKGELDWRRPNRATLSDLLHNPAYAGVYAYGRRAVDPGRRQPGHPATGRRRGHELDDGIILLRDRMPAYISWEAYLRNRDQMQANRTQQRGVARGGPALLAGLVVCGRCGHRMLTVYNNNGRDLRYLCGVERASYGTPLCQSLAGRSLDRHIAELVLQAVQPSALETSLQLVEDLELERAEQQRQWRLRLERARYEADRARRQYDAVEPENRLVARALEQQWEEALTTERRLLADYERARAEQPVPPSAAEQEAIRRLAADVPALWADPGTTDQDRQTLVRLVLDHIVVTVEGMTEAVIVDAFWAGGARTRTRFRRPVASLKQLSTYGALAARVAELREAGYTHAAIADTLNAEGWMPAKRCAHFTGGMIGDLLRRQGVMSHQRSTLVGRVERQADEVTILELAERLAMPHQTVFAWLRRGWLHGRLAEAGGQRIWLIQADEAEMARLAAREHVPKRQSTRPSTHQTP